MKKFKLYTVISGERMKEPVIANGFAEAENVAKELYKKYHSQYPSNDTYIECVESELLLSLDHLIFRTDCFGKMYWKWLVMGDWCPLYEDLLSESEQKQLQEWREEKEIHVIDLCEEDLKELYYQVTFGSCFLSDYENEAYIDENEVCDVCERYERWVDENNEKHCPKTFAYYVIENERGY